MWSKIYARMLANYDVANLQHIFAHTETTLLHFFGRDRYTKNTDKLLALDARLQ